MCDWKDKEQRKYFLYYNYINDELSRGITNGFYYSYQTQETGFYMSETVAEKLQSELLKDYKIYLGVK